MTIGSMVVDEKVRLTMLTMKVVAMVDDGGKLSLILILIFPYFVLFCYFLRNCKLNPETLKEIKEERNLGGRLKKMYIYVWTTRTLRCQILDEMEMEDGEDKEGKKSQALK